MLTYFPITGIWLVNLIITVFALFLCKNLYAEEIILPIPKPKIEIKTSDKTILPKSIPEGEVIKTKKDRVITKNDPSFLLPKNKPLILQLQTFWQLIFQSPYLPL